MTRWTWLPADDPGLFAHVMQWLVFSAGDAPVAAAARPAAPLFEVEADDEAALRAGARKAFRIMDDHMTAREFDGGDGSWAATPTVADIALFPAIALSRDFGIEHDAYPALRRWMRRFRAASRAS